MKYNCKVKCPKCREIFEVNVDSKKEQDYFLASCPACEKKIKLKTTSLLSCIEPKQIHKKQQIQKQRHSGPQTKGIVSPLHTHLPQKHGKTDFGDETYHVVTPPISPVRGIPRPPESEDEDLLGIKPKKEDKFQFNAVINTPKIRLKVAFVLLLIVFVLGLIHGVNSVLQGTNEGVVRDIEKPDYVDIHGRVIDSQTGQPIKNIKVSIMETGQSNYTNTDGQYYIPNVKTGDHNIKVEAKGYVDIIKVVTLDPELMGIIDFELDEGVGVKNIDDSIAILQQEEQKGINFFAVMIIIFACFGLVSAILIYFRNFFLLCVLCAFLSILSIGAIFGFILGLIAFILIILSSSEFEKPKSLLEMQNTN